MFHTFWPLTIHSSPSRTALVAEAGEVAAGAGLAEQLAPLLLAGEHRAQEAILLLVAAVGDDGGAGERHEERARVGGLGAGLAAALLDEPVEVGAHAEPAELLGEVHPRQPGVVAVPAKLEVVGGGGRILSQKGVDGGSDPRQLRIVRSAHRVSLAAGGVTPRVQSWSHTHVRCMGCCGLRYPAMSAMNRFESAPLRTDDPVGRAGGDASVPAALRGAAVHDASGGDCAALGAGILVLLPALERDAVLQVLRALLAGPVIWSRALLTVAVGALHGARAGGAVAGDHRAHPVLLPRQSCGARRRRGVHAALHAHRPAACRSTSSAPPTNAAYEAVHGSAATVGLLVPGNDRARARIDRQLGCLPRPRRRRDARTPTGLAPTRLFELAAARRRTLVEEVAKVEYGIVRHMLRLQVIVLRYVKALLVIVVTAIADVRLRGRGQRPGCRCRRPTNGGSPASMVLWAPIVLIVVSSPVRWLESLLRSEGAKHTAVSHDHELTQLEDVTARFAGAAWLVARGGDDVLWCTTPSPRRARVALACRGRDVAGPRHHLARCVATDSRPTGAGAAG